MHRVDICKKKTDLQIRYVSIYWITISIPRYYDLMSKTVPTFSIETLSYLID